MLLEARNISKSFSDIHALVDVSFSIAKGQTFSVVGGSGCGKSTLAKVLCGLLEPDKGQVLWEDYPIRLLPRPARVRRMQMVFQDPYASLNPKLSIGTQLMELAPREVCVSLLRSVGLDEDVMQAYPFQFSGGQRQRIAIARALVLSPMLLIADEPLSALDLTTQAQIIHLFRKIKEERDLTLLFITHDLAVAEEISDHILVMNAGRVVESGLVRQVLQTPQNEYTKALLNAVPRITW